MVAAAVSLAVFWAAVSAHVEQACALDDTPYLPLCADPPASPEDVQAQLRERIQRNPGDSWAWAKLLLAESEPQGSPVLRAAAALAPNHSRVLLWRAADALERQKVQEGVELLVQILSHRSRKSPEAAKVLAQIAATPDGALLLRPHLADARRWLPSVLGAARELKLPPGAMLPLVVDAVRSNALPPAATKQYMQSLRAGNHWLDAYGLWLAQHKGEVPLLYNGGFDHALQQDGFDWEYTPVTRSRTGVIIEQHAVARRGLVMELDFTGRALTRPILRQYLFLPPGSYRLRGEYMASKLRSEGGLVWSVVCPSAPNAPVARSSPVHDTGGLWKVLELGFTIQPDCGAVARLQLETGAPFETAAGMKGRVEFDGFSLTRALN